MNRWPQSLERVNPQVIVAVLTFVLLAWGFTSASRLGALEVLDESQVVGQVRWFAEGKWQLYREPDASYPAAAMFPGYQFVLYLTSELFGVSATADLRWVSFGFTGLLAAALYMTARTLSPSFAIFRVCQCLVLPVLFPYHFLLYTDAFSLIWNVSLLYACLSRRYLFAGLCSIAAIATRQDNVMAVCFLIAWTGGFETGWQFDWHRGWTHLRRSMLMLLPVIALGFFVVWHGRVGLDAPHQQPTTISLGNLAMVVIFAGGLFLPTHLANLSWSWRSHLTLRKNPAEIGKTWSRPIFLPQVLKTYRWPFFAISLGVFFFAFTFVPGHRWNFNEGMLRNRLIEMLTLNSMTRLFFGTAIIAIMGSLALEPMISTLADGTSLRSRWLYAFWAMRLLPVLLIEPRYYIVPFVFWLLLRKHRSVWFEASLWTYMATVSIAVHWLITSQRAML